MTDDLEPLPSDLQDLIAAHRAVAKTTAPGKARVNARLQALLVNPPRNGGGGGGGNGPAVTTNVARTAMTFASGLIVGGAIVYLAIAPTKQVVVVEKPVVSAAMTATALETIDASTPMLQRSLVVPSAEPFTSAPANPVASPTSSLAAERAILDPARTALGRGDGVSALEAVRAHERRFPSGALVEEREAIAIQALVLVGKKDEARSRGARFMTRYPGSVLGPTVNAAIEAAQ
jgi:hypothetical protein